MRDIYYRTKKLGDLTVRGASRASIQTFWNVPEYELGLDAGAHPSDFTIKTHRLFITHTHRDHITGLYQYIARRKKTNLAPPEIYVPEYSLEAVSRFLGAFQELDEACYPYKVHGINAGDQIEWQTEDGRTLCVEALETFHRIPSLGYAVYENSVPRLAYTGDTLPDALDLNPVFYEAEILIMEMTASGTGYTPDLIHQYEHTHLQDVLDRQNRFQNRWIVAAHFTCKQAFPELCRNVAAHFPDRLGGRLIVW